MIMALSTRFRGNDATVEVGLNPIARLDKSGVGGWTCTWRVFIIHSRFESF